MTRNPATDSKTRSSVPDTSRASADAVTEAPLDGTAEHAPRPPFGQPFWMCNSIEMFERLAYFGIRTVVPVYIMQATEPGGLHLTAIHKGWIYMWWAIFQSWFPMFTGGFADRYGYKRVLFGAISANIVGYVMMAFMHSYYGFFAGILVLATGTAFFKPALQGTIAQNLTKANSSMGWGIFYWVVNIGGLGGPILATIVLGQPHSAEGWRNLFLASAAYTSMNLLLLLTFRNVPSGADKSMGLIGVFWRTIENIWPYWFRGGRFDARRWLPGAVMLAGGVAILVFKPFAQQPWLGTVSGVVLCLAGIWFVVWLRGGRFAWQLRLPAFLVIMSCFWMMMYQLWDLHPNFIEDWIDSASVAKWVPFEAWREYGDRGLIRVPQQILLNLNAALIVLLVVPVSWLVRKMRTLESMLIGMSVATAGILVAGLTGNGWVLLLGILFFSLGEMLTGPKKNEYLGLIAPPGKKGLYLGYVNIPIGLGVGFGSLIAGHVYDRFGEKASLALRELGSKPVLLARAAQSADWSDALDRVPKLLNVDRDGALEIAAGAMHRDRQAAADELRGAFRYDRGQITNLGLVYLAVSDEFKTSAAAKLASLLKVKSDDTRAEETVQRLTGGGGDLSSIGVARFVDLLPDALDVKRPGVFELLRDRVNSGKPAGEAMEDAAIVDMLWERFGDDRDVLNNLALEYLAQATNRMHDVVAGMTFANPVADIDRALGLGRTKSFAALAAAMGADDAAVNDALAKYAGPGESPDAAVYTYLINQPQHRFLAVARKDWTRDIALLRQIVDQDEKSLGLVRAEIDVQPWYGPVTEWGKGLVGAQTPADMPLMARLAENPDLIQRAFATRDWSDAPGLAARLLGLNPYEARAIVAAEVAHAPVSATRMLWERYHPQYLVWCPFAAIGVLAAVALAVFGQMAKRWTDMNA